MSDRGMLDFYMTRGGRDFCDHTIPQLTKAMNRLADAIEKQNALQEKKEAEEGAKNE